MPHVVEGCHLSVGYPIVDVAGFLPHNLLLEDAGSNGKAEASHTRICGAIPTKLAGVGLGHPIKYV